MWQALASARGVHRTGGKRLRGSGLGWRTAVPHAVQGSDRRCCRLQKVTLGTLFAPMAGFILRGSLHSFAKDSPCPPLPSHP
ncbi:hypothetical protein XFF6992_560011 [Xanthomonas citri pv. fuscans]|nr:hypothetical protein XFF6992_560011 [Xanthomonas citri pv. fuscans]SOO35568.1 hypothetical protein XFF6994_5460003 [Xanthomonas citri pv. fuscans]